MGITERKEREREERRALIMRCAKELILELGVEKVSMRDIAHRAELSKATLYLYFPSKELLFTAICDEAGRDFVAFMRRRVDPGAGALKLLMDLWTSYLEFFGEEEDIMLLLFHHIRSYLDQSLSVISEEPGSPAAILYTYIKDTLDRGAAEGIFESSVNSGMVSRTIIGLFSYVLENTAKIPREERKSRVITSEMKTIFEIMLRGIVRDGFDRSLLVLPEH